MLSFFKILDPQQGIKVRSTFFLRKEVAEILFRCLEGEGEVSPETQGRLVGAALRMAREVREAQEAVSRAIAALETPDAFRRWAEGPQGRGTARDPQICPLALYLADDLGIHAEVTYDQVVVPVGDLEVAAPLPGWARRFVWALDLGGKGEVSPEEILEALGEAD